MKISGDNELPYLTYQSETQTQTHTNNKNNNNNNTCNDNHCYS